mmetsp:Transcript_33742/g.90081  ORF Transcript_33742/g.90081 Transcript_33742/m.90081 type:complete len:114 (-) Transcript_33742:527-868(-)
MFFFQVHRVFCVSFDLRGEGDKERAIRYLRKFDSSCLQHNPTKRSLRKYAGGLLSLERVEFTEKKQTTTTWHPARRQVLLHSTTGRTLPATQRTRNFQGILKKRQLRRSVLDC